MSFQRIFLYDLHFLNWKEKNKKFCPEEKSFCLAFGKFQIIFKTELNRIENGPYIQFYCGRNSSGKTQCSKSIAL